MLAERGWDPVTVDGVVTGFSDGNVMMETRDADGGVVPLPSSAIEAWDRVSVMGDAARNPDGSPQNVVLETVTDLDGEPGFRGSFTPSEDKVRVAVAGRDAESIAYTMAHELTHAWSGNPREVGTVTPGYSEVVGFTKKFSPGLESLEKRAVERGMAPVIVDATKAWRYTASAWKQSAFLGTEETMAETMALYLTRPEVLRASSGFPRAGVSPGDWDAFASAVLGSPQTAVADVPWPPPGGTLPGAQAAIADEIFVFDLPGEGMPFWEAPAAVVAGGPGSGPKPGPQVIVVRPGV